MTNFVPHCLWLLKDFIASNLKYTLFLGRQCFDMLHFMSWSPALRKGSLFDTVWHCAFTQPCKVVIPNQIATTWSLGEHSGILITWHGRNIFWFVVCKGEKAMYISFKSCFSFLALLYLLKHPPGQHHFPGSIMEMSSLEIELGPRERDPTQNGRKKWIYDAWLNGKQLA